MNADGRRPGGLTALAVLNFVFGGLGALGLLLVVTALTVTDMSHESAQSPYAHTAPGWLWTMLLLGCVSVTLMIASGAGYLGMKRWGRTLGNSYAILELALRAVSFATIGFTLLGAVGAVYPLLTLFLLNTTFKEDLVN